MLTDVERLVKEFIEKINIQTNSINITNLDDSNIFNIKIETDDSGILIGNNGKTFEAIHNILKIMCSNKVGEKIKINLSINDYSKTKDERLFDFLTKELAFLEKTGKDIQLPYYSSHERKKIHSFIHKLNNKNIKSKSIGEGRERRIYLSIKGVTNKLTIDIDGVDI